MTSRRTDRVTTYVTALQALKGQDRLRRLAPRSGTEAISLYIVYVPILIGVILTVVSLFFSRGIIGSLEKASEEAPLSSVDSCREVDTPAQKRLGVMPDRAQSELVPAV
jgi:hypothetical protein